MELHLVWEPEWDTKRMRWMFLILDADEAKLKAIFEELVPVGFRWSRLDKNRKPYVHVMVITKLAVLDRKGIDAEILRVHTVCERYMVEGLDDVDVEDPKYDDLSVN